MNVQNFEVLDSYVSVQGNTATVTREYMLRLKDDYRDLPNQFSTEMDVLCYSEVYQDNEMLTKNTEDFYPNVNFYVTSRTAKAMFKASTSGEAMDERIWKITIVFTGEGLNFQHLSTETVKIIDVETGTTPYNFNVRKAYKNYLTEDDVDDEPDKPTKIIQNTAYDPLLEGLTEVRNIEFIKITIDYIGVETFNPEWKKQYSNMLNAEDITVYNTPIEALSGMITVEGYKYIQMPPDSARTRVVLNIQKKDDGEGMGWVQRPVNQGFQAYGLPGRAAGVKDKIYQKDISEKNTTNKGTIVNAEAIVSDPVKLDDDGSVLVCADPGPEVQPTEPILLKYCVQPFREWDVLCLPEGQ